MVEQIFREDAYAYETVWSNEPPKVGRPGRAVRVVVNQVPAALLAEQAADDALIERHRQQDLQTDVQVLPRPVDAQARLDEARGLALKEARARKNFDDRAKLAELADAPVIDKPTAQVLDRQAAARNGQEMLGPLQRDLSGAPGSVFASYSDAPIVKKRA
jgi:hypothetical protein